MKFQALIFCLVVGANFEFVANCIDGFDDETNFESPRWANEIAAFNNEFSVENDADEEDKLTLLKEPPRESPDKLLGSVQFYLYTKRNRKKPQRLGINDGSLQASNYNSSQPTFFITHGWMNSYDTESCTLIRDAYLKQKNDSNVIVVDCMEFTRLSKLLRLRCWVKRVGIKVAMMIKYLQGAGYLSYTRTTLVGHSLGAHVMGIAGFHTQGQIENIIGLDPALPFFADVHSHVRISNGDAKYVQIIHTNGGMWGSKKVLGHADFFVNGGTFQPQCLFDVTGICAHRQAYKFFAESIETPEAFQGRECGEVLQFSFRLCTGPKVAFMGGMNPDSKTHGVFSVRPYGKSLYGQFKKNLRAQISKTLGIS